MGWIFDCGLNLHGGRIANRGSVASPGFPAEKCQWCHRPRISMPAPSSSRKSSASPTSTPPTTSPASAATASAPPSPAASATTSTTAPSSTATAPSSSRIEKAPCSRGLLVPPQLSSYNQGPLPRSIDREFAGSIRLPKLPCLLISAVIEAQSSPT